MQGQLEHLKERTDFFEPQMSNVAQAHISVVDTQDEHAHVVHQMCLKIADLEDCRSILETIKPEELTSYLQRLFHTILPNHSLLDMMIAQGHRIRKPDYPPAAVPRGTQACLHFFQIKEQLMWATRTMNKLPEPYQNISLFSNISVTTAQTCKSLILLPQSTIQSTNGDSQQRSWSPTKTSYLPSTPLRMASNNYTTEAEHFTVQTVIEDL